MTHEEFFKIAEDMGSEDAVIHVEVRKGKQDQVLSAGDFVGALYGIGLLVKSMHTAAGASVDQILDTVRTFACADIKGSGASKTLDDRAGMREFREAMEQIFGKAAGNGV